jgi:hypothetical protein
VDSVEPFRCNHFVELFFAPAVDVHFGRTIEFPAYWLLSVLPTIQRRIVDIVGVFLAIVGDSLRIVLSSGYSLNLPFIPYVVVR